jgi:integrase
MPRLGSPRQYKSHGRVIGYRIQWSMPDGRRKNKTFPLAAFNGDRGAARQAAAAELRRIWGERQAIADGRLAYNPEAERRTLRQFYDEKWKTERSAKKDRPKADDQYFSHLGSIEHLPVRQVDLRAVLLVRDELREKGLKAESQRRVLGFLRTLLNDAKERDPQVNPPSFRSVMPRAEVYQARILTSKSQVDAFLGAVKRSDAKAMYAIAVYAGLRAGELAGLRWGDFDLERRLIHVRRSYDHPPKTKPRSVLIVDVLRLFVQTWQELAGEDVDADSLVFPSTEPPPDPQSERDLMWRHDSSIFRRVFRAALKAAGLPRLRFHDLRHTFASLWVMEGGDMYQLLKMGGWSSFKMVEERYGHYAPERYKGTAGMFRATPPEAQSSTPSGTRPKRPAKPAAKPQAGDEKTNGQTF